MDLRFCIFERRRPQWESQCCCGLSFVHIEGCAAAGGSADYLCWAAVLRMFSAERARKHEEKRVLEKAQIEVPG